MRLSKTFAPVILGLSAAVSACHDTPAEHDRAAPLLADPAISASPPAWQVKIAGDLYEHKVREHNAATEARADAVVATSLDGHGRMVQQNDDTVDIYSIGVTLTLSPITAPGANRDADAKDMIESFRSFDRRAFTDRQEFTRAFRSYLDTVDMTDTLSGNAVRLGDNGYKATFNLQTNRVCVVPTANGEQDCFDARTLSTNAPLAKDIAFIHRKLGR